MNKIFFKRVLSMALSTMLIFSCFTFSAFAETTDDEKTVTKVKAELDATAKAMCNYIKTNISDSTYTITYNDFKNYSLILKSGYSDDTVTEALLNYVKEMINDTENPISAVYDGSNLSFLFPYIITFLNEAGENSSDFDGYNFNSALEEAYLDDTIFVNPYLEQYIISAVNFNKEAFSEPEKMIKKAEDTILNLYTVDDSGNTGIDYYGVIVDNNGQCLCVLKSLYSNDSDVKAKIDAALDWSSSQFSENGEIISWGSANPSSTAIAVKLFSEFNDFDNAAKAFNGLASFKDAELEGVYDGLDYSTYQVGDADFLYTTPDVLIGLLAYYRSLNGIGTLDVVKAAETPDNDENTVTTDDSTKATEADSSAAADTEATTISETAKDEVPPTADIAPVAYVTAVLLISGALYLGLNKKNAK